LLIIFSLFFSFFLLKHESYRNGLSDSLKSWYTKRWCKGASWYQVWLKYNKHLQSYLQLFKKNSTKCCHAHRVNCAWQEAENWYRGRLTIEPQTLCGLKEIELKAINIQQKDQQCVIFMRLRITNKISLLLDKPFSRINRKLVCGWIINFEEPFSGLEELSFNLVSYSAKTNYK